MGKFIIKNILIEKSDKDIQTGEKYTLSDGFNLICGNNEAGKSSLMGFIKNCFFKTKGIDTGKIYFKIKDKSYRADIKDAKAVEQRCKIFDEKGEACSYGLIEDNIKQKYFQEGFTINLDDLMKIQNRETSEFIDIIKDSSSDKLNDLLKKINNDISVNLSLDNKLKKNTKEITEKITSLNVKIKELSNKEVEYNSCLIAIKNLSNSINEILEKEEYLKKQNEVNKLFKNKNELILEKETALSSFNAKLFEDKEHYIDLIQSIGRYSSNLDIINRGAQKLELIKHKISEDKTRLNIETGLELDDEFINNFVVEHEKIHKIKDLVEEMEQIISNIKFEEQKAEDLEDTFLKLKYEIETILQKENKCNVEELEELTKFINEGLRQYHFLSSEIDNVEKETIINSSGINSNKKMQVLLGILFIVTVICAVISFVQDVQSAGIFSILMAILTLAGFSSLKLGSYVDKKDDEKERKLEQRENIINEIKSKLEPYYAEIENIEASYLPLKIDTIKQELQSQINEKKIYNESLLKYSNERNFTEEKLLSLKTKISNADNKIKTIREEVISLSDETLINKNIFGKKYLETVEIIKSIKNDLENKKLLDVELIETYENNMKILANVKAFILKNDVDITISEDINETIVELKKYYDKNNILKQHIDALNSQIVLLEKRLDEIGEIDLVDIGFSLEELSLQKEERLKLKKETEFRKRELEKVEGISELKTEKNILIEEYRNIIKNLFINKMTLELADIAKSEFDKTQPDLINAQKYLAMLTDNKYSKINLEMQELENEDGSKIKKWEHLSRGTKEQLYLALRLGYASNYSKDKTTLEPNGRADLPLIVDDAFVNFDVIRTKNALKCLFEFSKTNQVLFFTCHSSTIKKLLEEITNENLNVIQL